MGLFVVFDGGGFFFCNALSCEQTLAPTKLLYPLWWLELVGFYNGRSMPPDLEGALAPAASVFSLAGVLSRDAFTAVFACVATMV